VTPPPWLAFSCLVLYCLSRGLTLAAAVVRGRHQLFYVKLPNILGLDQRPFDRDTFEAADEDELVEGPEGTHCPPARLPAARLRHATTACRPRRVCLTVCCSTYRTKDEALAAGDHHAVETHHRQIRPAGTCEHTHTRTTCPLNEASSSSRLPRRSVRAMPASCDGQTARCSYSSVVTKRYRPPTPFVWTTKQALSLVKKVLTSCVAYVSRVVSCVVSTRGLGRGHAEHHQGELSHLREAEGIDQGPRSSGQQALLHALHAPLQIASEFASPFFPFPSPPLPPSRVGGGACSPALPRVLTRGSGAALLSCAQS
jgi:hypothetical protein